MPGPDRLPDRERPSRSISGAGSTPVTAAEGGLPDGAARAAPDVKDPVPGAHNHQIGDQTADRASPDQHHHPDEQARHALEALMLMTAPGLAISCCNHISSTSKRVMSRVPCHNSHTGL